MNLLIFITGLVIINTNFCQAVSSTTKAPENIQEQIDEYNYKVRHMIAQLDKPNLSKPEREHLEGYLKTLEILSNAYKSGSPAMKASVKTKFTLLAKDIDKYLKELEKRLPIGHTTRTIPTTPSTVASTTKGSTSSDHSTNTGTTGTTAQPTTQSFTFDIQKRIDDMIEKLKQFPKLSKFEVDKLKNYKHILQTVSNAYNQGNKEMKEAAKKKFEVLEKEINNYLDEINKRIPTPSSI